MSDFKDAFIAGFEFGRNEQCERDWPDVGFRINRDIDSYWIEYMDEKKKD